MATVNFFADTANLPSQDSIETPFDGAYGPVSGEENSKYRVTAIFKNSTPVKAYAIVNSDVIVIPVSSDLVNLILRPTEDVVFDGIPKVKYFIYRGILLSDFFSGDSIIPEDASTNNAIINDVHKTNHNLSNTEASDKFKTIFDLLPNLSADTVLDHLFAREDYYFPYVNAGDFIGNFTGESTSFGFEILLEENGFNPTLNLAKLPENIIDIGSMSGAQKETEKLEILNYIDPAAYFGLFTHQGFGVKDNAGKEDNGSEVYTEFASKFKNKNRVYIDIRNKYGLPIDIDYSTNNISEIKITVNNTSALSITAKSYRYYAYGNNQTTDNWPIYIIDEGFQNVNTDYIYRYYTINLSLPQGNAGNTTPLIHFITNHFKESWPTKKQNRYLNQQKYSKLQFDTGNPNWTKDIQIATFASRGTGNPAVAAHIKLEYTQYINDDYIKDQVINYKLHEIEQVTLFNQLSPTLINLPLSSEITKSNYNLIVCSHGDPFYSIARNMAFEATKGKAVDQIGEVIYCYRSANTINADNIEISNNPELLDLISGVTRNISSCDFFYKYLESEGIEVGIGTYTNRVLLHNFHKKNKNVIGAHIVQFNNVPDYGNNDVNCIEVRVNDPLLIKGLQGNSPAEQFISVAYTTSQKTTIDQLIASNFVSKRFVCFNQVNQDEIIITGERKAFISNLNLCGIKFNTGKLMLDDILIPDINFYSVDGLTFVTDEYATAVSMIGTPPIITNQVVPNFVGSTDPFAEANGFDTNTLSAIRTNLTEIAGTEYERARILYGEIRDYMYDGDLDNLTWEMAFRLPFYLENTRFVPYSDNVPITERYVTDGSSTAKRTSTPYIDYFKTSGFDSWFDFANQLRNLQIANHTYGVLGQLRRNGLAIDFDGKSQQAYTDLGFDENFLRDHPEYADVHAYHTRIWEDENPMNEYDIHPHLPGNQYNRSIRAEIVTFTQAQLEKLRDAEIISETTRVALVSINQNDFGYTEDINTDQGTFTVILDPGDPNAVPLIPATTVDLVLQHTVRIAKKDITFTTRFLYTLSGSTDFYILSYPFLSNNSGITLGYGFDMGQQSIQNFNTYTPYSIDADINYLVKLLNTDFNLYSTNSEINYSADPQTTYQDVLNAVTAAGITIQQLKNRYAPNLTGTDIQILTYISRKPDWQTILDEHVIRVSNGVSDSNYDKSNVINMALGTQGYQGAFDIFNAFETVLWSKFEYPRLKAICLFPSFVNIYYEKEGIMRIATESTDSVLKIYPDLTNKSTFYFDGEPEFLNEAEKVIFISLVYNGSSNNMWVNNVNGGYKKIARILAHAINTHDIRWLRYYLNEHKVFLYPGRLPVLIKHINKDSYVKHYRTSIYG